MTQLPNKPCAILLVALSPLACGAPSDDEPAGPAPAPIEHPAGGSAGSVSIVATAGGLGGMGGVGGAGGAAGRLGAAGGSFFPLPQGGASPGGAPQGGSSQAGASSGGAAQGGGSTAGGGQAGAAQGGAGQAGKGGAAHAGEGGAGQAGGGGAAQAGEGGAGQAGSSQAGGGQSQGGSSANECPDAPPGAACKQDADCGGLGDPQCGQLRCNCESFVCELDAASVGKACETELGKCAKAACTNSGACVVFETVWCPSGGPCATITCDPSTGLCLEPSARPDGTSCYDSSACKQGQTCLAGACQGGTSWCESDECNERVCQHGNCVNTPLTFKSCEDGDLCTVGDRCIEHGGYSTCDGKPKPIDCSGLDGECVLGACNPDTGECRKVPAPKGTPCDDGLACTNGGACNGLGSCTDAMTYVISPMWSFDLDDGAAGWAVGSAWRLVGGGEVGYPVSGSGLFACPTHDELPTSVDELSMVSPEVDLSAYSGAVLVRLATQTVYFIEGGYNALVVIEVFAGDGWRKLDRTDSAYSWRSDTFDVSAHRNAHFRVRFRIDPKAATKGPYITACFDDIEIGPTTCEVPAAGGMGGAGGEGGAAGDGGAGEGGGGQGGG